MSLLVKPKIQFCHSLSVSHLPIRRTSIGFPFLAAADSGEGGPSGTSFLQPAQQALSSCTVRLAASADC